MQDVSKAESNGDTDNAEAKEVTEKPVEETTNEEEAAAADIEEEAEETDSPSAFSAEG